MFNSAVVANALPPVAVVNQLAVVLADTVLAKLATVAGAHKVCEASPILFTVTAVLGLSQVFEV